MWPPRQCLPREGRFRISSHVSHAPNAACTRTARPMRSRLLHTQTNRPALSSRTCRINLAHRRWITQQYVQRLEEARDEWSHKAKEIKGGKRKSFLEHLEARGLVHDVVGGRDQLHKLFTEKRVGMYAGVDPTGPSLHVGHIIPFMVLAWGYVWGLPVTWVLGGATARVGDPTMRTTSRESQHASVRKANMANMHLQLKKLGMSIESYGAKYGYKREWSWRRALANNNTWLNSVPVIELLRDFAVNMRIGPMLGRETVKNRLAGEGMSLAEFLYPVLQAWDWWTLFQKGVQVQVGGSDQYGNILFGMDAVKEISKNTRNQETQNDLESDLDKPFGITTPLLTAANGEKLGKSAGNAIFLDKDLTSTFELYQYFVRTPDDTVERYLKLFTFVPLSKIEQIMEQHRQNPPERVAQHLLAAEFVELIHGSIEANAVATQHRQLFGLRRSFDAPTPVVKNPDTGPPEDYNSPFKNFMNRAAGNKYAPQVNFANVPSPNCVLAKRMVYGQSFTRILFYAGMVSSKSEAFRLIQANGAHVGSRSEGPTGPMPDDVQFTPIRKWVAKKPEEFILEGGFLFVKVGKWKFKLIKVVEDEEFKLMGITVPGWNANLEEIRVEIPEKEAKKAKQAKKTKSKSNEAKETES